MKYAWLISEIERREREMQRERQRPQIPLYIEDARFYERPVRDEEPKRDLTSTHGEIHEPNPK